MRSNLSLILGIICAGTIAACQSHSQRAELPYSCSPMNQTHAELLALKGNDFELADDFDQPEFALALTDCLRDTNPDIRDGVAYEALTKWMRAGDLDAAALQSLKQNLLSVLNTSDDAHKVGAPFAALVLSELARADRISPFMSSEERSDFARQAADYVSNVDDYRGYIDGEGWRHGVAHGADWLMQLALNEQVGADDLALIRDAVAAQIRADHSHAYIHGESMRLARPVLFIARRGVYSEADWSEWIADIADPAPLENWSAAFQSESGLAQRHNVGAFLHVLYVNADNSENENIRALLPGTLAALKTVP